jgi:hypothetical protein
VERDAVLEKVQTIGGENPQLGRRGIGLKHSEVGVDTL